MCFFFVVVVDRKFFGPVRGRREHFLVAAQELPRVGREGDSKPRVAWSGFGFHFLI
jgi:hypothetical protein